MARPAGDERWMAVFELIDPKDRERWIADIIKKHPKAAEKLGRAIPQSTSR